MKLTFTSPVPWPMHTMAQLLPITEPAPTAGQRDVEIALVVRPLDPLVNYWGPWKRAMIDWGKPQGGKVDLVTEAEGKTVDEWEVQILDSLVKDVEGKVVEARLTVLYFMLEWCCMASLCGRPERLAAERDKALGILLSARPDWEGPGVAAISQLYE